MVIRENTPKMTVENPHAAGADLGSKSIWVSVPPNSDTKDVREFSTTTDQLHTLVDWLMQCGVDTVAMEATGVYWIPLYELLEEHGIKPCLVNAYHVKTVPGRKSDLLDCQWLRRLHTFGLLRSSFRPTAEIVELRQYMRHRNTLVQLAADHTRRIQKTMVLMNLHLHNVISDVMGKTGLSILRAIIHGERDPQQLAKLRDGRCRKSTKEIEAALTGNYKREQIFTLRHEVCQWNLIQKLICECDKAATTLLDQINHKVELTTKVAQLALPLEGAEDVPQKRQTKPSVDYASQLNTLIGVDLTKIPGISDYSATVLISEIGTDMSQWPTMKHFASWLRLTPRLDITGGKARSRRTMPGISRASEILRTAAVNAGRTLTAIGAFYRKTAARKGKGIAVVATAHKIARIIYAMLATGTEYQEAGAEHWEKQYRQRAIKNIKRNAKKHGFQLVRIENGGQETPQPTVC